MLAKKIEQAEILLEALPYIQHFSGKIVVIKYGGSLMVNDDLKAQFARDVVLLKVVGMHPVIVHGGGKEISKWMTKLGKKSVFIDGLRVTDAETMEITEMVLSGKITNDVVALMNAAGGKAVGVSGKDANLFLAQKRKSRKHRELGFVGDITSVDTTLLHTLNQHGYIPVISSVGRSTAGETLNMNADHVAEAIAVALEAMKLIFLTDVKGLKIDGELKSTFDLASAESFLSHPDVQGGMKPKLSCAIDAIKQGVDEVHIIDGGVAHAVMLELFTDTGIGSMLRK
ncbi:MAG: acetylglutamate kinase [bacterium]